MTTEKYAVINTESSKILTTYGGKSVFRTEEEAVDVLENKWGGESHLEVVKVVLDY